MSFRDFPAQPAVQLLQRSLEQGRLAHAYLFSGTNLSELEAVAQTLAKTANCQQPPSRGPLGLPLDSCDQCLSCRKIAGENHADVQWVRPESKSRVITIDQMRDLMQTIFLKPNEAAYKVAIIVAADRLNVQAANAFLKTLEEPPARSIIILLTTEPHQMLETILSRCLRLSFFSEKAMHLDPTLEAWLKDFSQMAAVKSSGLLSRYRLLGTLLAQLNRIKKDTEKEVSARSPLERYEEVDNKLKDRWEEELNAAIEAEYRRRRAELLTSLQWWLRDVWLQTHSQEAELLNFPDLGEAAKAVAQRITPEDGLKNLEVLEQTQRHLASNVQEALALEVGLLKLKL